MPEAATHWLLIAESGLVYNGPCTVTHIILWPDADADYVDIYDGRDPTTGSKFCSIKTTTQNTRHIGLGQGIHFDRGVYVALGGPGPATLPSITIAIQQVRS